MSGPRDRRVRRWAGKCPSCGRVVVLLRGATAPHKDLEGDVPRLWCRGGSVGRNEWITRRVWAEAEAKRVLPSERQRDIEDPA
jgi:hypothetical protein